MCVGGSLCRYLSVCVFECVCVVVCVLLWVCVGVVLLGECVCVCVFKCVCAYSHLIPSSSVRLGSLPWARWVRMLQRALRSSRHRELSFSRGLSSCPAPPGR